MMIIYKAETLFNSLSLSLSLSFSHYLFLFHLFSLFLTLSFSFSPYLFLSPFSLPEVIQRSIQCSILSFGATDFCLQLLLILFIVDKIGLIFMVTKKTDIIYFDWAYYSSIDGSRNVPNVMSFLFFSQYK